MTVLVVCITCGQQLDDAAPLCPCDRERLAHAISRRLAETGPAPQAQTELERIDVAAPKRPRGRPPLDPSERRDARLTVRVTAATLADLEARAKREAKAPAVLAADILERAARR